MTNLISVQNLEVSFRMSKTVTAQAVKGVSFDIPANSTVALVGESGSGKSVTAMSIVRLLPENAILGANSKILYDGRDLLHASVEDMRAMRGRDISVVFQEPMSSLNPVFTVGEQIAEVLRIHMKLNPRQALEPASASLALSRGAKHVLALLTPYMASPQLQAHLQALTAAYSDSAASDT